MYFETKCRYTNIDGKPITEPYLVDAVSCTEAEARITKELSPFYSDIEVTSVKKSKLSEVLFAEADYYYLVKANFPTIDEKTAQEKENIIATLVQASSLLDAQDKYAHAMTGGVADWEYVSIALTPIVKVLQYECPNS